MNVFNMLGLRNRSRTYRGVLEWAAHTLCRTAFLLASISVINVDAAPAGMTVQRGTATLSQNGNQQLITASHNAFLNWQSFNINAGEITRFIQPSASSIV